MRPRNGARAALSLCLAVATLAAAVPHPAEAARVVGRVVGSLPPMRKSPDLYGKFRRTAPGTDVPNPLLVVLKPAGGGSMPKTERRPVIDQKDERFRPNALVVQAGTTVDFLNSDNFYHNVFSLSAPRKFDLGRYRQGIVKSVTFDKIGLVKLFCDIHPSMLGYVLVTDSPWGAAATPEGRFEIADVPPGEYEAFIWHEPLLEPASVGTVTVAAGGGVETELPLPAAR
jgi:plastocyanin